MPLASRAPVIPASSAGTQRHDQSRRNLPPRPPTPPERTPPSPPTSHASALSRLPFLFPRLLRRLRFLLPSRPSPAGIQPSLPLVHRLRPKSALSPAPGTSMPTCPLRQIRPDAQDSPAPQKIRSNCLSPARTPSGGSGWRETVPPFTPTLGPRPGARSGVPGTLPCSAHPVNRPRRAPVAPHPRLRRYHEPRRDP